MKTICTILAALALLATPATAQQAFVEGTHYTTIPGASATPSKQIEEFFAYHCPHCYHMLPRMQELRQKLPQGTAYIRVPAFWNSRMEMGARAYYTAQALGVVDQTHRALFDEIHRKKKDPLKDARSLEQFYAQQGLDGASTRKALNSFQVQTATKRAQQRMREVGLKGPPTFVVNGKYVVAGNQAVSPDAIPGVILHVLNLP